MRERRLFVVFDECLMLSYGCLLVSWFVAFIYAVCVDF